MSGGPTPPGFQGSLPPLNNQVDGYKALMQVATIHKQLFTLNIVVIIALVVGVLGAAAGVYAAFFRTHFPSLTTGHLLVNARNDFDEGIRITMEGGQSHFQNGMTGVRVNMPSGTSLETTKQTGVLITGGAAAFVSNGPFVSGLSVLSPGTSGQAINVTNGTSSRLITLDGADALASSS